MQVVLHAHEIPINSWLKKTYSLIHLECSSHIKSPLHIGCTSIHILWEFHSLAWANEINVNNIWFTNSWFYNAVVYNHIPIVMVSILKSHQMPLHKSNVRRKCFFGFWTMYIMLQVKFANAEISSALEPPGRHLTKPDIWAINNAITTRRAELNRLPVYYIKLQFYSTGHQWTPSKLLNTEQIKASNSSYCDWVGYLYWPITVSVISTEWVSQSGIWQWNHCSLKTNQNKYSTNQVILWPRYIWFKLPA